MRPSTPNTTAEDARDEYGADGHFGLPVSPEDLTLGRFIEQAVALHGDREAIVSEGRRLTYAELLEQVHGFANGLLASGVTKGSKVALLLGNRSEFVVAAYAAGMVGAVVVPISTMLTPDERDYILGHSDASLLVTQPTLLKRRFVDEIVESHPGIAAAEPGHIALERFPYLRRVVSLESAPAHRGVDSWDDVVTAGTSLPDGLLTAAADSVHPSDDAMIIYTSGTTAHPKAVLHRHRAPVVQNWRWAEQLRLDPSDRFWSSFPFFWTAGLATIVGGTLASGACLVCQDAFEPAGALELIEQERVTTLLSFPHPEALMVDHPDAQRRNLSSLRKVSPGSLLRKVVEIEDRSWGPQAAFGLSEAFTIATSIPSSSPLELRQTTHGVALPGMAVRIVEPVSGRPVPVGDSGEIAVKGVTMMRGYYKVDPEECFDDEGWFRTQDGGHLDEQGYLHWDGRLSGIVKTAGANVAPAEVEAVLQDWGRLKLAAVVGLPHPTLGEAVVLCAVPSGDDNSEEEILAHLRSVLATYKLPKRILFFDQTELTYTGSFKVRVSDIRAVAAQRVAAAEDDWAAFLRERHADLLEAPTQADA